MKKTLKPISKKDQVFSRPQENIRPFSFDQNVAEVFDDMVERSIPFYKEIHQLIVDLVFRYYNSQGQIIDLGCSTGTTIKLLSERMKDDQKFKDEKAPSFIGLDNSNAMIEIAQKKCQKVPNCLFVVEDMMDFNFQNSEIVILNYTLQFLKKEYRTELLEKIYDHLLPGGIVIISEKIYSKNEHMQHSITDLYYDFKRRNGYSELEISQKREALENVLTPLTPKSQVQMMEEAGFKNSEMLFRWYNFASYLGVKEK